MIFRLNSRGKIIAILATDGTLDLSLLRGFDFISLVEDQDRPSALALLSTSDGQLQTEPVELRLKISTVGSSKYRITASKDKDLFLLAAPVEAQSESAKGEVDSSKQRARLLFDKLPLALLVVSQTGVIEAANTVACTMFDYSATSFSSVSIDQLLKLDNTELRLIEFLKRMIGRSFHATGIKSKSDAFPVEVHSQFLDNSGEVLLLSVFDISKQEELERFKRDLLKVLRHGIRGPLTSLRLFLGTLKKGFYRTKSAEKLEERASLMFDETSKLIQLTSNLLAFEKLDSDPASYDWTIISVPELIEACRSDFSANFTADWSDRQVPAVSIFSNAERLKKAFCDLLTAVATGSEQMISISMEAQSPKLTISIRGSLPPESQDSAETDEALLNLNMARAIIEACGGEVEIVRSNNDADKILIAFACDSIE